MPLYSTVHQDGLETEKKKIVFLRVYLEQGDKIVLA